MDSNAQNKKEGDAKQKEESEDHTSKLGDSLSLKRFDHYLRSSRVCKELKEEIKENENEIKEDNEE